MSKAKVQYGPEERVPKTIYFEPGVEVDLKAKIKNKYWSRFVNDATKAALAKMPVLKEVKKKK